MAFYVIKGSVDIQVNEEVNRVEAGQCLVSEPGKFSMTTQDGVKIMPQETPFAKPEQKKMLCFR